MKLSRIAEAFSDPQRMDAAIRAATRRAIREHKQAGVPMVSWRDGRMVIIPPEELPDLDADGAEQHGGSNGAAEV